MFLENRDWLHSCDAGQDGEDLMVPRRGGGGMEEELMHSEKRSERLISVRLPS